MGGPEAVCREVRVGPATGCLQVYYDVSLGTGYSDSTAQCCEPVFRCNSLNSTLVENK